MPLLGKEAIPPLSAFFHSTCSTIAQHMSSRQARTLSISFKGFISSIRTVPGTGKELKEHLLSE